MHAGADKQDDAVRLGQTYTYTWHVRERSGPGPKDPSSVIWIYHSHHSEVQDTNTGLYGAMIISAQVDSLSETLLSSVLREEGFGACNVFTRLGVKKFAGRTPCP